MGAYEEGHAIGAYMRQDRENGDGSYDCRWDLADASKEGTAYFKEFRRGLDDGLSGIPLDTVTPSE